jgi:hypothetical protein
MGTITKQIADDVIEDDRPRKILGASMTTRLSQPLPSRSHERDSRGWRSLPWSRAAALSAFTAGGWFDKSSRYCFEPDAEEWIRSAQRAYYSLKGQPL